MAARDIPLCIGYAYEQYVKGEKDLDFEYPALTFDDPPVFSLAGVTGPITAVNKSMLLFLACRDGQKDRGYALWQEVKKLTGEGDAYEYEAAKLLCDALWPPDPKGYTRSQLKVLDDRLVQAAKGLCKALSVHPDFRRESSAVNWPIEDAERFAKITAGLKPQVWPDPMETKENGAPIFHGLPMYGLWRSDPTGQRSVFRLVAAISPTMEELTNVLGQRAKALASKRFKAKKSWQASGEANDTIFIRHLLAQMIFRNPDASADRIAKIISPIVDKALGLAGGGRPTFDRCKKGAQTFRARLKTDPDLQAIARLNNPRSPYWKGK